MRAFFKTTVLYLLAAIALTAILHGDWGAAFREGLDVASAFARITGAALVDALPLALPLLLLIRPARSLMRLRNAVVVVVASTFLQAGFLLFKSAIPELVPFYADPVLAEVD